MLKALHTLTEFALDRSWLILVLTLFFVLGLGIYAFREIPIDAFPDVSTTQVKLILKAPGMTPEEVETRITQPVETELLGIPKQTVLRSLSKMHLLISLSILRKVQTFIGHASKWPSVSVMSRGTFRQVSPAV